MTRTPAGDSAASLGNMHALRMRRLLFVGSAIIGATGLLWAIVFSARGEWTTVSIEVSVMVLAAITATLTKHGRTRSAVRLMLALMYVVLCFSATFLDVPTSDVPRSIHQFLIPLGVLSCLMTRGEPAWLRYGAPLACFATYAVLASTDWGMVTPLALPHDVRAHGAWVNHAIAMVMVFATLQIMQTDLAERNALASGLGNALIAGEMMLHYQPQVNGADEIVGAEALVRWQHPQRGMVSPGEFIPLAEKTGLMLPLGDWVLRTACAQLAAWSRRPETASLQLAVNVSALQFAQPDFVSTVLSIVQQSGANTACLKLELTESMLAHDLDDIIAKMTALRAQGVRFSLDDFGTGFSSLSYLHRLPLDQLKIDQSFVRNMTTSPKDAAIVQALITLSRSLGLEVIAEGVETSDQRRLLTEGGCPMYQGYLFSRPLPIAAFEALLAESQARDAHARTTRATTSEPLLT